MHISPPPFLFMHLCEIIVHPTCLACDVISSRSIVLLIQVSVIKPMSIFSDSIWCRTISNLCVIDCVFVRKNLVSLPFQYTGLCLGSDLSHLLWMPLFWSCILGQYFPPLDPLKVLFIPSSFIFKHAFLSRFDVYLFFLILHSCPEVYIFSWSMSSCSTCPVCGGIM